MSDSTFKNLLLAGAVLGAGYGLFAFSKDKKTEREHFRFQQADPSVPSSANSFQGVPQRPSLIPQIPPRFDANRVDANSLLGQSRAPPMPLQAAPPAPTLMDRATDLRPDFRALGAAAEQVPGALTSQQAQDALRQKVGSGMPEYQETADLLPVADMKYTAGVDPTDPQNFMYDRTIFGQLKRRYGTGVDFIRGDLNITPEYRGWFDLQPPTDKDVVKGYFQAYLDVEQGLSIRDAQFDRSTPIETIFAGESNQWGDQSRFVYNAI